MHTPSPSATLFETRRGFVFYCSGCQALHAQMGNAVITCGRHEFARLQMAVKRTCANLELSTESDHETHLFAWDSPAMGYAFTKRELFELRFLVEGATAVLRRNAAIQEALSSDT